MSDMLIIDIYKNSQVSRGVFDSSRGLNSELDFRCLEDARPVVEEGE